MSISQGLAVDPHQRHASMQVLLRKLERLLARRRRRAVAIALTAGALVAGGMLALTAAGREPAGPSCDRAEQQLWAAWNPVRATRAHAAFARHGLPYGEATWKAVHT